MGNVSDMTVGSPTRAILQFAIPLIAGYLLQQMYMVADAAIVGQYVGVGALAAVGTSSSIMFLVMGFCTGTSLGFSIPVAHAFGAKDFGLMRRYVAGAVRLSVLIAVVLTVVTTLLTTPILKAINAPADIMPDAYIFLLLQFLTILFTIGYNLLAGFIRALGNSRQPFYVLILSSLLNIVLDLLLIVGCGLGVEGAGVATMAAQAFAVLLCYIYIRRSLPMLGLQISSKPEACSKGLYLTLLNNGVPMGLQFSITGIGIIMLQSANNALGTTYVAAFTACMRVKYLFTCVFENIGAAMATYCGQNIGARKVERIALGIRSALKIMLCYFLFTLAIIWPLADEMMLLFVDPSETAIIDNAALFMRICNYYYPVLGLLTILRYSIQGLGHSNLSMLSGVMEMLARGSVAVWLVPAWGFLGVIYGDPVAWLSADLFLVPCMFLLYRHLKRKKQSGQQYKHHFKVNNP